ncbi:MAG: phosphotransferase [Kouleothrix sp.]|nr:phosphotransferase [Kouleothrix sp.]
MDVDGTLAELLDRWYGAGAIVLRPLRCAGDRCVCKVERADGPAWVLRAFRWESAAANNRAQAAALLFLERAGFPASRLVRARGGGAVVEHAGWQAIVTTFVEGCEADFSEGDLLALGAALGRLHRLDVSAARRCDPPVEPSEWRAGGAAIDLLGRLRSAAGRVPIELRTHHADAMRALERAEPRSGLPDALIHTDCFPGNAFWVARDTLALSDWDGAGIGPAIIDLATTLISCDKGLDWEPRLHPSAARVAAVVEGYRGERALSPRELAALPDALRYAPAVRGAWCLAETIDGSDMLVHWRRWWARYQVAEEVAEMALRHLA